MTLSMNDARIPNPNANLLPKTLPPNHPNPLHHNVGEFSNYPNCSRWAGGAVFGADESCDKNWWRSF